MNTFSVIGRSCLETLFHGRETMYHFYQVANRREVIDMLVSREGVDNKNDLIRMHNECKFMDSNVCVKFKSGSTFMHFMKFLLYLKYFMKRNQQNKL